MYDGLLDLSWWQLLLATLALTHVTIAAVTIYLHRAQAHRGLDLHPAVAHFFRFWLWLTTGMVTKEWVSIHRKHHARCETPDDPHSPQVLGIRKVFWQGSELYRAAAADPEIGERFGRGTPDDWLERRVYTAHSGLGVVLMLGIDVLLFGPIGLTVWAVQMLWIPVLAAGVINGIGHYWGYRNYESADAARNILPWGILIGGEELHNNHHAFPSSAKLSSKRWEFDIGWMYIRMLSALGLARVKKVAPKPRVIVGKEVVDMDTLRAVVVSRMHVLARYAQDVLMPVSSSELCKSELSCRKLKRQARKLLLQREGSLDRAARRSLQALLEQSQALETVYQYRQRLREVWEKTASSQENLLQSLQEWVRQAEASGVKALEEFARTLRGYSLPEGPALVR
jgi:stearoyl-CoA desaturase (delta-9 desaturase)